MKIRRSGPHNLLFFCPGCRSAHQVRTDPRLSPCWEFNGDDELPTFNPSVLLRGEELCCHSFIRDGNIQFLEDSTHALSGKTVPLPDFSPLTESAK